MKLWFKASAILLTVAVAGCSRPADLSFVSSAQVAKLKPELQEKVRSILLDRCGTPQSPRLVDHTDVRKAHLKQGAEVYSRYCLQCHGVTGDGTGPASVYLIPRPRDYRPGVFKFTSTKYGAKPLRDDLIRTVKRGIRGTSMPSFNLLPPGDLAAVVDYVLALTRRGELESLLAEEAEFNETIEPNRVPEMVAALLSKWIKLVGRSSFPPPRCLNSPERKSTRGRSRFSPWRAFSVMEKMVVGSSRRMWESTPGAIPPRPPT